MLYDIRGHPSDCVQMRYTTFFLILHDRVWEHSTFIECKWMRYEDDTNNIIMIFPAKNILYIEKEST